MRGDYLLRGLLFLKKICLPTWSLLNTFSPCGGCVWRVLSTTVNLLLPLPWLPLLRPYVLASWCTSLREGGSIGGKACMSPSLATSCNRTWQPQQAASAS
jgi:hypothetical protein